MTIMTDRESLAWEVYAAGWREALAAAWSFDPLEHPRDERGRWAHKGGGMLGGAVGKIRGGKWKFTRTPKTGDVLEDAHGDQGVVAGVSADGKWVAAQWELTVQGGKRRREIINTEAGDVPYLWYQDQETARTGQDWIRVVNGGVPLAYDTGAPAPRNPLLGSPLNEGRMLHPVVGKLEIPSEIASGARVKFDRPPKLGDHVADTWGDEGEVVHLAQGFAAIEWPDRRRAIVNVANGNLLHGGLWMPWQVGAQDLDRDWHRLEQGKPPIPPKGPSPPGEQVAPGVKQLTFPGMPESHQGGAAETARRLDAALASDSEHDTKPGEDIDFEQPEGMNYFGNNADTNICEFADGSRWVRKRGIPESRINAEVAYSRVSEVFGTGSPLVVKRQDPYGRAEMWEPFIDAQTAIEWTGGYDPEEDEWGEGAGENDPQTIYSSSDGQMIGLVDTITGMSDRHMGNWLVVTGPDGAEHPVAIDNESASFPEGGGAGYSPFGDALDLGEFGAEHPDAAGWDEWEAGLERLRAEFTGLGMENSWRNLVGAFTDVRQAVGA